MLLFTACISLAIALMMAIIYKEPDTRSHVVQSMSAGDSKVTIGIKTFIISFIVVYLGLVFFAPASNMVLKGQMIETCEPDF